MTLFEKIEKFERLSSSFYNDINQEIKDILSKVTQEISLESLDIKGWEDVEYEIAYERPIILESNWVLTAILPDETIKVLKEQTNIDRRFDKEIEFEIKYIYGFLPHKKIVLIADYLKSIL